MGGQQKHSGKPPTAASALGNQEIGKKAKRATSEESKKVIGEAKKLKLGTLEEYNDHW